MAQHHIGENSCASDAAASASPPAPVRVLTHETTTPSHTKAAAITSPTQQSVATKLLLCNPFGYLKHIIRFGALPRWASSIGLPKAWGG